MQKTAYEMRISDWSSDVCSSDLVDVPPQPFAAVAQWRPDVEMDVAVAKMAERKDARAGKGGFDLGRGPQDERGHVAHRHRDVVLGGRAFAALRPRHRIAPQPEPLGPRRALRDTGGGHTSRHKLPGQRLLHVTGNRHHPAAPTNHKRPA